MAKNEVWKKLFDSKIVTFIIILALFGSLISVFKMSWRRLQLAKEAEGIKQKVSDMQIQNNNLKDTILYLQSPDYVEKEARKKLDLKKAGETVIIVPQDVEDKLNKPMPTPAPVQDKAEIDKPISNWLAWFNYFIGKNK